MSPGTMVFYRIGRQTAKGVMVDMDGMMFMQTHPNAFVHCNQIDGEWFGYKSYSKKYLHRLQKYRRQPIAETIDS